MTESNNPLPLPESPDEPEAVEPVGSAHMRADGTLELKLSAQAPGGILGEAMFIIKPDDPRHPGLVELLGGIEPEGYAAVPPLPPGSL
jgi:hypothetical protein